MTHPNLIPRSPLDQQRDEQAAYEGRRQSEIAARVRAAQHAAWVRSCLVSLRVAA